MDTWLDRRKANKNQCFAKAQPGNCAAICGLLLPIVEVS